jgi:hypothetical protein
VAAPHGGPARRLRALRGRRLGRAVERQRAEAMLLRAPRGSRVGLRLEAAGCHLFPVPGETGLAAGAGAGPAAAAGQFRPP